MNDLLNGLTGFENFFKKIGLKRIDGSVFGLLVLSESPLSSEEVEKTLNLSQAAVSQTLKTLTHYGAIITRDCREKRCNVHTTRVNSLAIVATLFRKREQQFVEEFKETVINAQKHLKSRGEAEDHARSERLESIVFTCEMAEAVMEFVIELAKVDSLRHFGRVAKGLPHALKILVASVGPLGPITSNLTSTVSARIKGGLAKFSGDFL